MQVYGIERGQRFCLQRWKTRTEVFLLLLYNPVSKKKEKEIHTKINGHIQYKNIQK